MILKKNFHNKKLYKKILPLLLVLSMCLLSGCGQKEGDQTKAGFSAIGESDYDTVMQCFQAAIDEGEDAELAYRGIGFRV